MSVLASAWLRSGALFRTRGGRYECFGLDGSDRGDGLCRRSRARSEEPGRSSFRSITAPALETRVRGRACARACRAGQRRAPRG